MHEPQKPLTVSDWFAALNPAPPKALADQMRSLLHESADRPATELPEVCMRVAEQSLSQLQSCESKKRGSALTLLSIDALMTYAFEAAASDPARIEERALGAMARISEMVERESVS
jgi:hypothetical protein